LRVLTSLSARVTLKFKDGKPAQKHTIVPIYDTEETKGENSRMSASSVRRILVISLILLWIAVGALDQRNWWWAGNPIPLITTVKWFVVSLFMVVILLHVFWLNRKPYFSFFKRLPNLSARGARQLVVLLLTVFALGIMLVEADGQTPEPWWRWWYFGWTAAAVSHMWLNRKALFSYLGQRLTITSIALLLALICLQATAGSVGMFL
jgi:hypothetical protein